MDTARYLKSQGWLGAGHALSAGKGLSKPILVSQKLDVLGLGKRKHNQADQWWARAFDNSLQGLQVQQGDIGADGTKGVTVTQTEKDGLLESLVAGRGALYSMFVKGEGLAGTIGEEVAEDRRTEKWRREELDDSGEGTKQGWRNRKEGKNSKIVDEIADSGGFKLKRERRRRTKALNHWKRADLWAKSTCPRTSHYPEGGDTKPRVNIVDDKLKQERNRRKKSETTLDASNSKLASKNTTPTAGEGEATAPEKARRKNRRLMF